MNNLTSTINPDAVASAAQKLREAEERDNRAAAELLAFCEQMAWNATLESLNEQYGIDPQHVTARGKSRWTNRGMFEGPISILGLKVETRAVVAQVDDSDRFLGYRTEKKITLVRTNFMGVDKPVTRTQLAAHLEKVARKARRR